MTEKEKKEKKALELKNYRLKLEKQLEYEFFHNEEISLRRCETALKLYFETRTFDNNTYIKYHNILKEYRSQT